MDGRGRGVDVIDEALLCGVGMEGQECQGRDWGPGFRSMEGSAQPGEPGLTEGNPGPGLEDSRDDHNGWRQMVDGAALRNEVVDTCPEELYIRLSLLE